MRVALRLLVLLLASMALLQPARAQAQPYEVAQLEALLAPVALYPDAVLWQVLDAATTPEEVLEAAEWSRANPGMEGNDAVRAVQERDWQPAVKSLVAYPELLARMAESPQWLGDLGAAYAVQQADVLAAVQVLRRRAQGSGHLQSDSYQSVQVIDHAIAVRPVVSGIYSVRYYDPFVVFGGWRWAHRPVHWRPWAPRPVFVRHPPIVVHKTAPIIVHKSAPIIVHPGPVHEVHKRHRQHIHDRHHRLHERESRAEHRHRWAQERADRWRNGPPSPAERQQRRQSREYLERHGQRFSPGVQRFSPGVQPYRRIPEANRRPIVQSHGRPAIGLSGGPSRASGAPFAAAPSRGSAFGTRPRPR